MIDIVIIISVIIVIFIGFCDDDYIISISIETTIS